MSALVQVCYANSWWTSCWLCFQSAAFLWASLKSPWLPPRGIYICVTLTPYTKGPPGTLYCIKAQLAGIYLSARPLAWESYDRYTLLRKGDTNCINYAQVRYIWEIKHSPSGAMTCWVLCFIAHMYLFGMIYVIHIPEGEFLSDAPFRT